MKYPHPIHYKPAFYFILGLLLMFPVLWIARTSFFYFCYAPLIVGAVATSGAFVNNGEKKLPSRLTRCISFISGMILTELIYSLMLIASRTLSFSAASKNEWLILLIELLLGIAVFELFFVISILSLFIGSYFRKRDQSANH